MLKVFSAEHENMRDRIVKHFWAADDLHNVSLHLLNMYSKQIYLNFQAKIIEKQNNF